MGNFNNLNISFLIGNGFDIGILRALKKNHTTTYVEFYNYLKYYLTNKDNFIYKEIENANNTKKWTDFELILESAVNNIKNTNVVNKEIFEQIDYDWKEIQYLFADFLNQVITPAMLKLVSNLDGKFTLEHFVGDLSGQQLASLDFCERIGHRVEVNYHLFNFNYSALLDNYVYWLFDHHPFANSTNNANFYPNPANHLRVSSNNQTNYYIKAIVKTYHPHGRISIPASILFGTSENGRYKNSTVKMNDPDYYKEELRKRLDKAYWNRFDDEFAPVLKQTDLFVIYGHSIGESDKIWWRFILQRLSETNCELIIYSYGDDDLKERILKFEPSLKKTIEDKIFVIRFDDKKPLKYGFNFK